jgi:hypothetical protein
MAPSLTVCVGETVAYVQTLERKATGLWIHSFELPATGVNECTSGGEPRPRHQVGNTLGNSNSKNKITGARGRTGSISPEHSADHSSSGGHSRPAHDQPDQYCLRHWWLAQAAFVAALYDIGRSSLPSFGNSAFWSISWSSQENESRYPNLFGRGKRPCPERGRRDHGQAGRTRVRDGNHGENTLSRGKVDNLTSLLRS